MNINAKMGVGALFKLVCRNKDTSEITKETGWFSNIVLTTGLNRMSVGRADTQLNIGTGNSTPTISQTALDSFLASTTTIQSQESGRNFNDPLHPYFWGRKTFRFAAGVATGNVAEVGLGWSNTNCLNRSLIKDVNGNPTVITILSDEYLDVIVEFRVYPQASISGSFNLRDKNNNVVSTHTYTGKVLMPNDPATGWVIGAVSHKTTSGAFTISSANIVDDYTTIPNTNVLSTIPASKSNPTPTSMRISTTIPLNSGNGSHATFAATIQALVDASGVSAGALRYKWQITPPITKINTWELEYLFTLTWDRHTP